MRAATKGSEIISNSQTPTKRQSWHAEMIINSSDILQHLTQEGCSEGPGMISDIDG